MRSEYGNRHATAIPTYYSQDFRAQFGGECSNQSTPGRGIELFAYRRSEVVGHFCFDRLQQQSRLLLECRTLTFCNPLDVSNEAVQKLNKAIERATR